MFANPVLACPPRPAPTRAFTFSERPLKTIALPAAAPPGAPFSLAVVSSTPSAIFRFLEAWIELIHDHGTVQDPMSPIPQNGERTSPSSLLRSVGKNAAVP